MPFFTIFAFVIFWFYGTKRNQFYKSTNDGFLLSNCQVASTGCAADAQHSSLNNDLV